MTTQWPLADEFAAATREDWMKAVEAVLKGKPFDKTLVNRTTDNLSVQPLYPRAENGALIAGRAAGMPWSIIARVDHPDAAKAGAQALADLENGADGLVLVLAGSPTARGYGLSAADEGSFAKVLDRVLADLIPIRVEHAPFAGRPTALSLVKALKTKGFAPDKLNVHFGLNPLGDMARTGLAPLPWPELSMRFAETVSELTAQGFSAPLALADGRPFHEAGASEAQELAFTLSSYVALLRALDAKGLPLATAASLISATLAVDADQFLSIAKLRALRRLHARVIEASGLGPVKLNLHAETAWRALTKRDPWVNLLRGTIEAFSAGVGGADSLTVLPFTQALGLPDDFARRMARNTSLVLIHESNLHRVADPSSGAGGIDTLTEELSQAAWALFQQVEAQGGLANALVNGFVQKVIGETREARTKLIATRREPITGVSEFPDIKEAPVEVLDVPEPAAPALPEPAQRFEPLPSLRLAEAFEALRDKGDKAGLTIFLANIGTIADFTARATFAKNVFEAGGITTLGNDGFVDEPALIAAFKASKAPFACLCSTDALYAEKAVALSAALKKAGAKRIYLAGRAGENEKSLRDSGVDDFIFAGANILTLMAAAYD